MYSHTSLDATNYEKAFDIMHVSEFWWQLPQLPLLGRTGTTAYTMTTVSLLCVRCKEKHSVKYVQKAFSIGWGGGGEGGGTIMIYSERCYAQ